MGKAGEPVGTDTAEQPGEVGRIRRLQSGTDVCVIAYGTIMPSAIEVARRLEAAGRSVTIVSCHTIKPLDVEGITALLRSHRQVVVIEEAAPGGGLGAQVKVLAWDAGASCRIDAFSLRDEFTHVYGSHAEVLASHGLTPERICADLGLA